MKAFFKENYIRIILHLLPHDFITQLPTGYLENELMKRRMETAYKKIAQNMLSIYFQEVSHE